MHFKSLLAINYIELILVAFLDLSDSLRFVMTTRETAMKMCSTMQLMTTSTTACSSHWTAYHHEVELCLTRVSLVLRVGNEAEPKTSVGVSQVKEEYISQRVMKLEWQNVWQGSHELLASLSAVYSDNWLYSIEWDRVTVEQRWLCLGWKNDMERMSCYTYSFTMW